MIMCFLVIFSLSSSRWLWMPEVWQFGFQDPATPIAQGIQDFHNDVCFFMVVILTFVLWMLGRTIWHFDAIKNPVPSKIIHGTVLELAWTVTPSFILMIIAVPSFALLYSMDEITDPAVTLKVIGHQWYWTYEYSDYSTDDDQSIIFDSYMVAEDDLELGQLRLLELTTELFYLSKHMYGFLLQLQMFFTAGQFLPWGQM